MSVCSRAIQRLRYLYGCVLSRERLRNTDAHQVWSALGDARGRRGDVAVERLEPRLLLDGSLPAPWDPDAPLNINAANTSNVDEIRPGGGATNPATGLDYALTGEGITLGIWDGDDVRTTHEAFYVSDGDHTSRVIDKDGTNENSDHATHVAGTMVAREVTGHEDAQGMAGGAILWAYDSEDNDTELPAAAGSLLASNHSYGYTPGWTEDDDGLWHWWGPRGDLEDPRFGKYDGEAQEFDQVAYGNRRHTIVVAAGNERWGRGTSIQPGNEFVYRNHSTRHEYSGQHYNQSAFDTLMGGKSIAKNVIVVGGIEDHTTDPHDPTTITPMWFTSMGPTDDGRIKPDLVTNGWQVHSVGTADDVTYVGGESDPVKTWSGTSMATPVVSGTVALLGELYEDTYGELPRSDMVRAVLIHTATDVFRLEEPGLSLGPDAASGWGLMDAHAAADLIAGASMPAHGEHLLRGTYRGDAMVYKINVTSPGDVKITVAWTDPPGQVNGGPFDDDTRALMNDLDTAVRGPGDEHYGPWITYKDIAPDTDPGDPARAAAEGERNTRDNVEQIIIWSAVPGEYTLVVSAARMSGSDTQDFAMVVTGAENITQVGAGRTGDMILLDLGSIAPGDHYSINGAEVVGDFHDIDLVPDPSTGNIQLVSAGRVVGDLVGPLGGVDSGVYYFAPSVESDLLGDTDGAETGFQGEIILSVETLLDAAPSVLTDVHVTVEAGYSGVRGAVVRSTGEVSIYRAQQRLNYLGFPDADGNRLELTGTLDAPTRVALQLFQAATDIDIPPAGAEDQSGEIDPLTAAWLNYDNAPRWVEMAGTSATLGETYATSWLVDLVETALAATPGASAVDVAALSRQVGYMSGLLRDPAAYPPGNYPGRKHAAGMEVDFWLPPDAYTDHGGNLNEQILRDLVLALHDAGAAMEMPLLEVVLGNQWIVNAVNAVHPGLATMLEVTQDAEPVMYVGFGAPPAPEVLSAEQQAMLMDGAEALADAGDDVEEEGFFDWLWDFFAELFGDGDEEEAGSCPECPTGLMGLEQVLEGGGGGGGTTTLGSLLDPGHALRSGVYAPIVDYLMGTDEPTVADLVSYLAAQSGLTGVQEGDDNTAEQFEISFTYATGRSYSFDIDLGSALGSWGFRFDPIHVELDLSLSVDVTLGMDLTAGSVGEMVYLKVENFQIGAGAHASNLTFGANVGFLGAEVQNGTIDLDVAFEITVEKDGQPEITVGDLTSTPIGEMISMTPTQQEAEIVLPIYAEIGAWNTSSISPQVVIRDLDVFDDQLPTDFYFTPGEFAGQTGILLDAFDALVDFRNLMPAQVVGVMTQLADWLRNLQESEVLAAPVPFADGATVGQILGINDAFLEDVIDLLESEPNETAFSTAQELLALIPGITSLTYSPTYSAAVTRGEAPAGFDGVDVPVLLYEFSLAKILPDLAATVDLGLIGDNPAANLGGISVDPGSEVSLEPDVDMTFTLGIDLSTRGEAYTVDGATTLGDILQWKTRDPAKTWDGLFPDDGADDLTITLRDGTSYGVNLDSLGPTSTLAQLIALLAAPSGGKLTAELADKRIVLTDTSTPSGPEPEFKINAAGGSMAGIILGLLLKDDDGDGVIEGGALHGDLMDDHVFLDDVAFVAGIDLLAPTINATANFGLVGLSIVDGSGAVGAEITISLTDPDTGLPGPVTISDLYNGLSNPADLVSLYVEASADFNLPVQVTSTFGGIGSMAGSNPTIAINWPTVFEVVGGEMELDLASFDIQFHNFDDLLNFSDFSSGDVVGMLLAAIGFIDQMAGTGIMDTKLPVINKSPKDVFAFVGDLADALDEFQEDPSLAFDELADAINDAIHGKVPAVDVTVSLDPAGPALRIDLDYAKALLSETLPFNFDLSEMGLDSLSSLIDVGLGGQGSLSLEGDMAMNMAFGVDLSDPASPKPFIYDETALSADFGAFASDLEFRAALGPLGIFLGSSAEPGVVGVGVDTNMDLMPDAPAAFSVTLANGNGDGRHYFDEGSAIADDLDAGVTAAARAELPIFYPTETTYLDAGNPNLVVNIADLTDPINTFSWSGPDFTNLISNLDLGDALDVMADGWAGLLDLLIDALDGEVLGIDLPLIGDKLKPAAEFLQTLRDEVSGALLQPPLPTGGEAPTDGVRDVAFVQQAVYAALGPEGVDWLGDRNGDMQITIDDVLAQTVTEGSSVSDAYFAIQIAQSFVEFGDKFDLDMGVPGLGLDIDGEVAVEMGFSLDIGFGVSRDLGVYFDVSDDDELEIEFEVGLVSLDATGQLLFLQLDADTLNAGELTMEQRMRTDDVLNAFNGAFTIDVVDPGTGGADGRLSLAELASVGSYGDLLDVELNANASIHLDLLASLGGDTNFPSIGAQFHLYWTFGTGTDYQAVIPGMEFTDIRLNIGEFFTGLFGGVLETVNDIIDPVRPVLDILTDPIPIISDLAGSPVALVDLARLFGYGQVANFIEAVDTIADLLAMLNFGDNLWIDLGGFVITEFDPKTDSIQDYNLTEDNYDDAASGYNTNDALGAAGGGVQDYYNSANGLNQEGTTGADDSGSIAFPILENPLSVFQLLMGKQDVVLFTYDIPRFGIDFTYSQFFNIIGPLGARLGGRIFAWFDFAVGYDTQGFFDFAETFDPLMLFNGLYLSDRKNPDGTGEDVNEMEVGGGIFAAAEVNLGIISGGVGGGIDLVIGFNFHDNDNDGKIRIGELWENFLLGPIWIFDINFRAEAYLEAYVKVGFCPLCWEGSFELARVTLFEAETERPDPEPAVSDDPVLASVDGSGLMTIHIGPNAPLREPGGVDGDELVILERGATPDEVIVSGFGHKQRYTGVNSIFADGGEGSDTVTIDDDLDQPAELIGGNGDDNLTAGDGPTTLTGGEGVDRLTGGDGDDTIHGDGGDDILDGGFGDDEIHGGEGIDTITGGMGDDELFGDAGNDELNGGKGDDKLYGGADVDTLYGDSGNDELHGDAGADELHGQEGQDTLYGGDDADHLYGGVGIDWLHGEGGADWLYGQRSNDVLYGGEGDDNMYGGLDSDELHGEGGVDTIYAGDVFNPSPGEPHAEHIITGGEGGDTIYGDYGDDWIDAGEGDNTVYSYDGEDEILAGGGNDYIHSGDQDDEIDAGDGDNTVIGGYGAEIITTGSGTDYIDARGGGAPSEDVVQTIVSGDGPDTIYGDHGADDIRSDGGADVIQSYDGDDYIDSGAENDTVTTWDGNDEVYLGSGNDTADLGDGVKYVEGNSGDDTITAGTGENLIFGHGGDDILRSGGGDDRIYAGEGDDEVYGGGGDDLLIGFMGDDTIHGEAGNDIIWGGIESYSASNFDLSVPGNFTYPPGWILSLIHISEPTRPY